MKRTLLATGLLLLLSLQAAAGHCDCPKGLEHLCRCKVMIETEVAQQQMEFLARVLHREFPDLFPAQSGVVVTAIHPEELRTMGGEPLQGLYDDGHIFVSNELLREQSLLVLAHEYGHVWHFRHHPDPDGISDLMAEGFAEWLAELALAKAGIPDLCSSIQQNPDSVYGRGFRWFKELEKEYGRKTVFDIAVSWLDVDGRRVRPSFSNSSTQDRKPRD